MKSKFDILFESVLDELNSLEDYETEPTKKLKSFNEFKHFVNKFDLICELDKEDKNNQKAIECSLYFINQFDNEHNQVKFDYYNKIDQKYYYQYKNIFDQLEDFRKHYIVTLTR